MWCGQRQSFPLSVNEVRHCACTSNSVRQMAVISKILLYRFFFAKCIGKSSELLLKLEGSKHRPILGVLTPG